MFGCVFLPTSFSVAILHLWLCWFGLVKNEMLQSLHPKDGERESHPCVNLHREKLPQLPWNSVYLRFVSCTSNLLARTYDFRKCTEFLLMLILRLQSLLQNQSLETVPICIVWQCFPHDNTVCIHMCAECKRSNEIVMCHTLWSILLWIVRACLLTIRYQVVQFLPNINISEQF